MSALKVEGSSGERVSPYLWTMKGAGRTRMINLQAGVDSTQRSPAPRVSLHPRLDHVVLTFLYL